MACNCLMCIAEGDNSPHRRRGASLSPTQHAYALLWRDMAPKSREVREARAVLLAALTKDEQRDAIAWVQADRPVTEREILEIAARAEPG